MSFQMPIFSSDARDTPDSVKRERTIAQIRNASKRDQDHAVQELQREAQASNGDEQTWIDLALGLFEAGHFENAHDLFRKLADAFPANDLHRLNVATCLSQMAQFDLCRLELEHIKVHGNTDVGRSTAAELLDGFDQWRGKSSQNEQFAKLKLAALLERVEAGEAGSDEYVQLARLLLTQETSDLKETEAAVDQARRLLEQGDKRFPETIPILEHLVLVYFRTRGFESQLNSVMLKLQRIAPESPVLQARQSESDEDAEAFSQRMRGRAMQLMEECQKDDPPLVQASLRELQKMVSMFAHSPEYRKIYAFALMIAGRRDEAIREAEILETISGGSHDMHFHLGQIFTSCGESARGLRHLRLALESAETQEDRDLTEQLIAQVKQQPSGL
jgi:Flp pilus assembly protein TadD